MLGLIGDIVIGVAVVAAGLVTFRLWKAHKAITAGTVLAGTEDLVKITAAEVSPAIRALIASLVATEVAKALTPKV